MCKLRPNVKLKSAFLVAGMLLTLSACQQAPLKPVIDPVEVDIANSAKRIQETLDDLSMHAGAQRAKEKNTPAKAPAGLDAVLAIHWDGPIETLIKKVMPAVVGYEFKVFGQTPAVPVIVHVHSEDITVYDMLRHIGAQVGNRAVITINRNSASSNMNQIELKYPR